MCTDNAFFVHTKTGELQYTSGTLMRGTRTCTQSAVYIVPRQTGSVAYMYTLTRRFLSPAWLTIAVNMPQNVFNNVLLIYYTMQCLHQYYLKHIRFYIDMYRPGSRTR